ncbi:MAG: hypothetical protein U5L96_19635 [Owenweeksia sp.]|nr:hypothetical protein [Owenweeksia sp.]
MNYLVDFLQTFSVLANVWAFLTEIDWISLGVMLAAVVSAISANRSARAAEKDLMQENTELKDFLL